MRQVTRLGELPILLDLAEQGWQALRLGVGTCTLVEEVRAIVSLHVRANLGARPST